MPNDWKATTVVERRAARPAPYGSVESPTQPNASIATSTGMISNQQRSRASRDIGFTRLIAFVMQVK